MVEIYISTDVETDGPRQTLEAGLATFEPGFVLTRQQPDDQIRAEISP